MKKTILLVISLISFNFFTAQNLVQAIEPIDDITVCDGSVDCVDLTAVVTEIRDASADYTVEPIPFDAVPVNVPVPLDIDDRYSEVVNMPFRFCYFGNFTNQLVIGANCDISFDTSLADAFDPWNFNEDCPDPALPSGGVFGPYTDVDPSVDNSFGNITYGTTGTAPFRAFVISYEDLPMFSGPCNNLRLSSQIVLHETTNFIDVYILNKPDCPTWNDGNAIIGVQNIGGTVGIAAPGRNETDSPWTAQNEGWRFKPTGAVVPTTFEWLDAAGTVVTNDLTTNVCPDGAADYTARVTYTLPCPNIGNVRVYEEDVTIGLYDMTVDLGGDITLCDGNPVVLDGSIARGDGTETYTWFQDNVEITGETSSTLTVATSGLYRVDVAASTCTNTQSVNVIIGVTPEFDPGEDILKCEDDVVTLDATPTNVNPSDVTYQWYLDGVAIAGANSPTLDVVDEGDYSVDLDNDGCADTKDVSVAFYANSKCVITQGISPDATVGLNDCLDLEWLNDKERIDRIEVFNRYGTKVYSQENYVNEWCGQSLDGDQLPTGTYFYAIYTQAQDPRTGWIYVNRDAN